MKKAYSEFDYYNAKHFDKLRLICEYCDNFFYIEKRHIKYNIEKQKNQLRFCSIQCNGLSAKKRKEVTCTNCDKKFIKANNQISRSINHFCSKSCAATYNNKNKKHGNRKSKLEIWIQSQLEFLYPNLDIKFNDKLAINSELDIYIPSLNIAFELNGIFHYEPIYGIKKLNQIQENDKSKSKACHDAKIDFCVIDTSAQKYFKEITSQKYLDIITNIINQRIII
jgi:hypothetical protein